MCNPESNLMQFTKLVGVECNICSIFCAKMVCDKPKISKFNSSKICQENFSVFTWKCSPRCRVWNHFRFSWSFLKNPNFLQEWCVHNQAHIDSTINFPFWMRHRHELYTTPNVKSIKIQYCGTISL